MIGSLLLFGLIGYVVDKKFDSNYKIYFLFVGALIAMYELYKYIFLKM